MRAFMLPFVVVAVAVMMILVVPIWLGMIAAFGAVMPWLAIGFLVWAAIASGRGPRQRRWIDHGWQARRFPPPPTSNPNQSWSRPQSRPQPVPPPQPRPVARPELPIDVQVKVEQIRRKAEVLQNYASRFPPFSQDLYIVRQTASEYLPRTIEAYLALPPGDGERIVTVRGKTALQELKEQLDLLDVKLDEIAEDLQRRNVDRLLANRRFLEERFGKANS